MAELTEEILTRVVLSSTQNAGDARLREVMDSLIKHLHAFIQEVKPSDEEWMAAINFLTETGKLCTADQQEFILLSDILGVTALKDLLNNPSGNGVTETTVLGPFYRAGAPEVPAAANIAGGIPGEPVVVQGKVSAPDGAPIPGAQLDIWQATGEGFYDVQLESLDGEMGLRGKIHTDNEGSYIFRTIKPSSYPIPHDGTAGKLLEKLGRHPYRPAHIHFIASADGYRPITTQIFVKGDEYLGSDAVFGVRDSLIVDFVKSESRPEAAAYGFKVPFYKVEFNFVLRPVR